MTRQHFSKLFSLLVLSGLALSVLFPVALTASPAQASARMGAWVDSVVFSIQDTLANAVSQLSADNLDIYISYASDSSALQTVKSNPELDYTTSLGSFNELDLNPAGPLFNDGRLNPFHNVKIREALNWLIDRDYMATTFLGDLGLPKLLPVITSMVDYSRYLAKVQALEAAYVYDPTKARQIITTEMQAMGAVLVNGKWHYNGSPITLIFLIRTEDVRKPIGNYVATQLESAGFIVDRQYKTRSEASPIWAQSDPAEGLFHIYTGGWISSSISRDEGDNFRFFYTPDGYPIPLWQAYTPSVEFAALADQLSFHTYADMAARQTAFERALELSLNDPGIGSVHVWLTHSKGFAPRRADTAIANDLAGGLNNQLWPLTVRFNGLEGGQMRMAQPGILIDPWNPIGGSNWINDQVPIRATQDYGILSDPNDGLAWPQRIDHAEVVARAGLPVSKTLDWVSLSFAPQITVPDDAWVDWDAANQRFITAAEKFTVPQTANIKSTVYYPADLFTVVKWHDGSALDLSDFVMNMIMRFDPGKSNSAIFNSSLEDGVNYFLDHFKGVKILSTDPLVIETYEDLYQLDAELNVYPWWPNNDYGPAAWHNLAVGVRADAAHVLAFTINKATDLGIEWMNYIGGDLDTLANFMNLSATENYIPYQVTLGAYITPSEAAARWANLQNWYTAHGHFWLGTGPFYLSWANYTSNQVSLQRNPDFPDPAGKWDGFVQNAQMSLNYTDGGPGSYLTLTGTGFPSNTTEFITINGATLAIIPISQGGSALFSGQAGIQVMTGPNGSFSLILDSNGAEAGKYQIKAMANAAQDVWFTLDPDLPVRPQEGSGEVVAVPPDIAFLWTHLPMVHRNY